MKTWLPIKVFDNTGRLRDLERHKTGIAFFHEPTNIIKNMTVQNQQCDAQSKQTTVKSPEGSGSERAIKIKAALKQASQSIVSHMRQQILTGQNGL